MGVADAVSDAADDADKFLRFELGAVTAVEGLLISVNVRGSVIRVPNVGLDRPLVGDSVRLLKNANGDWLCLGSTTPRAAYGTISSVVAGVSVTVLGIDGVTYPNLPYLLSYTPTIGHGVALDWRQGGLVLGRPSGTLGGNDPTPVVPPPPPAPTTGEFIFEADDSGSRTNGGSWADQGVWYGQSYSAGAWFYGTKIRDTLAGARVLNASIYLPCQQAGGSEFQIGVHGAASKPAGALAIGAKRALGGVRVGAAWYALDNDLAQYLVDNAGGGIGTSGSGVRYFTARSKNADSGKIRIAWSR